MKNYKSELINKILEQRGHEKSSLHYESECIETWINEEKGAYPKLTDYESEWLNYIVENPVGEFPYETITDVTDATVDNVVPYAYKSAILKGSTKFRDVDTGEVLDAFEEGRNLELVTVKMPVLTTTGKNLFDGKLEDGNINSGNGEAYVAPHMRITDFIKINENKVVTISKLNNSDIDFKVEKVAYYDTNKNFIGVNGELFMFPKTLTPPTGAAYIRVVFCKGDWDTTATEEDFKTLQVQIEEGSTATPFEPYKSNILTVNEDVTLSSNGDICDELNLLTRQLTQRIGEDGAVLSQEVVKTVDLSVIDQDGKTLSQIKPIEGTMHISTDGTPLKPTVSMEIPVEAITQNLSSFIEE